ncbi:Hypothetical_protein [Hexamita inflata]|uniref:Hypothetical_protein n=1 Tax=Hexamita inflata TaxID=28002 RepID=A0AA86PA45_9EUKA|nr:Hypothetical protein HINF_LOCUS20590 [Hexamita inflata]
MQMSTYCLVMFVQIINKNQQKQNDYKTPGKYTQIYCLNLSILNNLELIICYHLFLFKWSLYQNKLQSQTPPKVGLIYNGCVCSTANSFPDSTRSACVCPADATNNSATNVCECPQYSVVVAAQAACVCQPAYMVMRAKQCTCSQSLMKGSSNVNGVCKCPYQAVYGDKVCNCQIR